MATDLKNITPSNTLGQDAVIFGADSMTGNLAVFTRSAITTDFSGLYQLFLGAFDSDAAAEAFAASQTPVITIINGVQYKNTTLNVVRTYTGGTWINWVDPTISATNAQLAEYGAEQARDLAQAYAASAGAAAGALIGVPSVTALRALSVTVNQTVKLLGYYSIGGGGGGDFYGVKVSENKTYTGANITVNNNSSNIAVATPSDVRTGWSVYVNGVFAGTVTTYAFNQINISSPWTGGTITNATLVFNPPDDNGTIIASGGTGYWKRIINDDDKVSVLWFGAKQLDNNSTAPDDPANDSTAAFQAAADWCNFGYLTGVSKRKATVLIPRGWYRISSTVNFESCNVTGEIGNSDRSIGYSASTICYYGTDYVFNISTADTVSDLYFLSKGDNQSGLCIPKAISTRVSAITIREFDTVGFKVGVTGQVGAGIFFCTFDGITVQNNSKYIRTGIVLSSDGTMNTNSNIFSNISVGPLFRIQFDIAGNGNEFVLGNTTIGQSTWKTASLTEFKHIAIIRGNSNIWRNPYLESFIGVNPPWPHAYRYRPVTFTSYWCPVAFYAQPTPGDEFQIGFNATLVTTAKSGNVGDGSVASTNAYQTNGYSAANFIGGTKLVNGAYDITFTSSTNYEVKDPSGNLIGTGTVGANFFSAYIQIRIVAGATPFAAGDGFIITCTVTSSGDKITFVASGAIGNQVNIGSTIQKTVQNLADFISNSSGTFFSRYNADDRDTDLIISTRKYFQYGDNVNCWSANNAFTRKIYSNSTTAIDFVPSGNLFDGANCPSTILGNSYAFVDDQAVGTDIKMNRLFWFSSMPYPEKRAPRNWAPNSDFVNTYVDGGGITLPRGYRVGIRTAGASINRVTTPTPDGAPYSLEVNCPTNQLFQILYQPVNTNLTQQSSSPIPIDRLYGKTLTCGVWCKSTERGLGYVQLDQYYNDLGTVERSVASYSGSDQWELLTVSTKIRDKVSGYTPAAVTFTFGSNNATTYTLAASTPAKRGGSVGNGTMSSVTTDSNVRAGTYQVKFTSATTFDVINPYNVALGSGTTGVLFSNEIIFTITAGSTPFESGDGFITQISNVGGILYLARPFFCIGNTVPMDHQPVLLGDTDAMMYGRLTLNTPSQLLSSAGENNSTTPSAAEFNLFTEQYTTPTSVSQFTGGRAGQEITIFTTTANITFVHTGSATANTIYMKGGANVTAAANRVYKFLFNGTKWYEV